MSNFDSLMKKRTPVHLRQEQQGKNQEKEQKHQRTESLSVYM